jgi:hypothetical protein
MSRSISSPVDWRIRLKNLYVDGFTSNQIWEQATRILQSTGDEIERDITFALFIELPASGLGVHDGTSEGVQDVLRRIHDVGNKKRKRSDLESDSVTQLQLKNLYVDGFTSNQIWEQAVHVEVLQLELGD